VCGNGTITSAATGLIWLQQGNCLPSATWADANRAAAGLKDGDCGLTDGSGAGDWRLPTADEANAAVATFAGATPGALYWTGTGDASSLTLAKRTDLSSGHIDSAAKTLPLGVWPVRGGAR
jgi:hypothetical protein